MAQLLPLPQNLIVWGENVLASTISAFPEHGIERPIVFSVDFLDAMRRDLVEPHLVGSVGNYLNLPAHAPDIAIEESLERIRSLGARSIIAHGGGSVLDAAKAASHLHHERTGTFLPIAALPTTLSGSEFSHYFGITETNGPVRFKRSYAVRETVPTIVVLDPLLLLDTPVELLLSSAIKGMDHAVEGMRTVDVDHPHAIMAASGLNQFAAVLERWPRGLPPRLAIESGAVTHRDLLSLQLAAWHCYFAPASVIYGLSHRIGHILGGTYGLPHSVTSCITLAPVIRACADRYGPKLSIFGESRIAPAAAQLANRIEGLVTAQGLPDRVGPLGLDRSILPDVHDLLVRSYPAEVADLGDAAEAKLTSLLDSLW
ncbi:iron-containing alcohol dehydrogenase [Sphingopyxis fribergensis]|uniref:Iron-containing alcohol dehydrogenase n=1 Tax=Sphingopyxis fribergensis TaxID=1515612 RepID=A0A0A7PHP6_9SPHN|nr:iron-containing alcohol dehydrogenase [Sphingopyxis fribergensis]AJA09525.1 iron-containing alcohol dehydrogenase [Sphingopyxis fribergensis]